MFFQLVEHCNSADIYLAVFSGDGDKVGIAGGFDENVADLILNFLTDNTSDIAGAAGLAVSTFCNETEQIIVKINVDVLLQKGITQLVHK